MKRSKGNQGRRGVAFVAVVAVSLVAFASLGGVGLAQSAVALTQYQYGKKVTICHKGKHTTRISARAWSAHKRHGDNVGMCVERRKKHHKKHHGNDGRVEAGKTISRTVGNEHAENEHGKSDHGRKNGNREKSERGATAVGSTAAGATTDRNQVSGKRPRRSRQER